MSGLLSRLYAQLTRPAPTRKPPAASIYQGKIDKVDLGGRQGSALEFIDAYLRKRGSSVTNSNRQLIANLLQYYPGHAPYRQDEIQIWLDKQYRDW